ncbi:hypothetical protein PF005_g30906 [Phytophthora fragariae]|uniref:Uncharacterized protein n=2 Tax=Phytophthora TaxID=4783 RepID=A0A6A4B277_9STRA|nr:hypothetical protein PF003_g24081 [Phytophthora fragariae]KAE8972971.1 hypothetical protein PR002_g26344 [Phytophthora rubi]KAE8918621.1 hypothetical protein PF009_g31066 [Phytophthora fragariae]KAE8965763.1 hypothetical protein PF011_g28170 [Phytophthora fragariae]KAE8974169.1 hypothetical protein PR001_g26081 [Phytophthora rubi]
MMQHFVVFVCRTTVICAWRCWQNFTMAQYPHTRAFVAPNSNFANGTSGLHF